MRQILFEERQKVISFQNDKLQDESEGALLLLCDKASVGAVGLEPMETSFDAVDVFVLEKRKAQSKQQMTGL